MSATEVVRRLLDERGVEWWQKKRHTCWKVSKGQEVEMWRAWEAPDGSLTLKVDYIYGLTPEQAIATALGSCNCPDNCTNGERTGTCHPVISDNLTESEGTGDAWADCSECGHLLFVLTDPNSEPPRYCPNCGRRIVQ